MDIYTISAVVNLIVSVFIGGIIWRRGRDRRLVNALGLFSLTLAIWSFGYIFWQIANTAEAALFWTRILMMGAIFSTVTFFHFTLAFLGKINQHGQWLYSGYFFTVLFGLANYTDYFVADVREILSFSFWPEPGILFHPFLAIWLFYAGFAVHLLYKAYQPADTDTKNQIWYILAGIAIAYIGGSTNYFLWYGIKIPPIGTMSVSLFQGLVAYAIAKHQLFNMKVIITEFFSWLLVSILFINLILSSTPQAAVKNAVILVSVSIFAFLLVRSVYKEVRAREKAEELTAELQEANQELKFMDKQKSKMLSIASHQFRSPLTSIEGYASLMKDGSYGEIPEHLQKPVDRIYKSSKQLSHIVDDFLNISRIEQGRMEYEFTVADVHEIVQEVVDEAKTTVEKKGLNLQVESDDHDAYPAKIDTDKFQQVITNLVDNAIKYTQEGGIEAQINREEDTITVAVEDSGIGIDPEDQDAIFEQFSRADEAENTDVAGSGLGLYIAKQIIEAHQGEIWAESPGKGEGATFYVQVTTADNDTKEQSPDDQSE